MKKLYRLKKNEDFSKVIKKRQTVKNQCFVVYYMKNNLDHCRIGVSVSKKLGNAVVRNKTKRQVRMLASQIFDFTNDLDYIIIVRQKFLDNSYSINKTELEYINKKITKREDNHEIR